MMHYMQIIKAFFFCTSVVQTFCYMQTTLHPQRARGQRLCVQAEQ